MLALAPPKPSPSTQSGSTQPSSTEPSASSSTEDVTEQERPHRESRAVPRHEAQGEQSLTPHTQSMMVAKRDGESNSDRHAPTPKPRGATGLEAFISVAPALLAEAQGLVGQLDDPYNHTHAEALARVLRTFIRLAKDVRLYRVARVARGLELFAQSLSNGTIMMEGSDWTLLSETHTLLLRMLGKLQRYGDESRCEQETAEAKCWLLSYRPLIARLVVQLSD